MPRRVFACAVVLAALLLPAHAEARNPQVAGLQVALKAKGLYRGKIDGIAGPATARAVKVFQRRAGVRCDGVAGAETRRALGRLGRPLYGTRVLRRGRRGWDVSVLQFLLRWRGYRPGRVDGHFGRSTERAVRRFQRRHKLPVDGIAGRQTLARLCTSRACQPRRVAPRPTYRRHVVRPGDNLTAIAVRYRLTVRRIARVNRLDPSRYLQVGRVLRIPRPPARARVGTSARIRSVRATIDYWSRFYGVDYRLVRAVAWHESGYQNHVRSRAGAFGIMQITPATWDFVETVLLGRSVPRTAAGNVRVGVVFLRHLLRQFRGSERLALAAYYQGAAAVRRRGLFPSTRLYVANVLAIRNRV